MNKAKYIIGTQQVIDIIDEKIKDIDKAMLTLGDENREELKKLISLYDKKQVLLEIKFEIGVCNFEATLNEVHHND